VKTVIFTVVAVVPSELKEHRVANDLKDVVCEHANYCPDGNNARVSVQWKDATEAAEKGGAV
jgi:hypothetical protein